LAGASIPSYFHSQQVHVVHRDLPLEMVSHSANATPSRHQRINAMGTSSHSSRSEDNMSVRVTPQRPRDGGARTDQVAVKGTTNITMH